MNAKITLAMLMCGIGAAGIASAATPAGDVPTVAVKYDPASLDTDAGARQLYARLAYAAVEVCPNYGNPHLISHQVEVCRQRAIEGAVAKVHNERLAAVYRGLNKNG
jgi:UrcA family protein